jgi:hypothetical protein
MEFLAASGWRSCAAPRPAGDGPEGEGVTRRHVEDARRAVEALGERRSSSGIASAD